MSDFLKFEDDSEQEHPNGDLTGVSSHIPFSSLYDDKEEFRNERLDHYFRRNPIISWFKMMFPHIKLVSVTSAFMTLLLLIYAVEMFLWYNKNHWDCVTYHFGSNYTPAIQRWHLHRLVFPGFLHNDVPHLGWNLFVLAAFGMNAEYYLGTIAYTSLLGLWILVGNTCTAGFRHDLNHQSLGSSVSIMGVIGFELVWGIFNLKKMNHSKWLYLVYFSTILATTVLGTFCAGNIMEFWGHFGGFVAGICVTWFFFTEVLKYDIMDKGRFAFVIILAVLFASSVITIFFRDTRKVYDSPCDRTLDLF
jgi:membrane associated rhomboid family serine protease